MSRSLKLALAVTDLLFLAYWTMSGLAQLGAIQIPRELMYALYDQPMVVAWNWSFLPLDLLFSVLGLTSVTAARRGLGMWRPLALMSLAFTMAVAYWTILREFDPAWFLPNLTLIIWPLFFLPGLVRAMAPLESQP